MQSRFGAQYMPFFGSQYEIHIFATKSDVFLSFATICDNNCNRNAILNKNSCFIESQKRRQRGREPERAPERSRERELQRARENHRDSLLLSLTERVPERAKKILSDSLWLSLCPDLLTKPLLGPQGPRSALIVAPALQHSSALISSATKCQE